MRRKLSRVPENTRIFIDANIFLSEILEEKDTVDECSKFLDKVRNRKVKGFVSFMILNEVFHRTLVAECIHTYKVPPRQVLSFLKKNPEKVKRLKKAWKSVRLVKSFVETLEVSNEIFEKSLKCSKRYGLLSNDSIHVETMKAHGIRDIATNDEDFRRVKGIRVWMP
jgi:hypothetical protein